jgi:hypothetical protein
MKSIELRINRLAQGVEPLEEGIAWFNESAAKHRLEIMRALDICVFQSHPNEEDVKSGIAESGLKDTYSPCVLVLRKPFNLARQKVLSMVGLDQERAFRLFLHIFSVADRRRRETQCKEGCSHEWHNLQKL